MGYNPYLMSEDEYTGAYLAVVESVSKLVAMGFEHKNFYLTFQEYFEKLRDDPAALGQAHGRTVRSWPSSTWALAPLAVRTPCPARSRTSTCRPHLSRLPPAWARSTA